MENNSKLQKNARPVGLHISWQKFHTWCCQVYHDRRPLGNLVAATGLFPKLAGPAVILSDSLNEMLKNLLEKSPPAAAHAPGGQVSRTPTTILAFIMYRIV